jgi:hypothetical protein
MITSELKAQIIAALVEGGMSADGRLNIDSVTVFLKGSPAHLTVSGDATKLPLGNFEYESKDYAVYAR